MTQPVAVLSSVRIRLC